MPAAAFARRRVVSVANASSDATRLFEAHDNRASQRLTPRLSLAAPYPSPLTPHKRLCCCGVSQDLHDESALVLICRVLAAPINCLADVSACVLSIASLDVASNCHAFAFHLAFVVSRKTQHHCRSLRTNTTKQLHASLVCLPMGEQRTQQTRKQCGVARTARRASGDLTRKAVTLVVDAPLSRVASSASRDACLRVACFSDDERPRRQHRQPSSCSPKLHSRIGPSKPCDSRNTSRCTHKHTRSGHWTAFRSCRCACDVRIDGWRRHRREGRLTSGQFGFV